MNTLESLQNELSAAKEKLKGMQSTLDNMKSDPLAYFEDEITDLHNESLNDCFGELVDALPFYCGDAASLCEDKDPTFYRQSLNDYADCIDVSCFDAYTELESEIEDLENEIAGLEEEIEELENEEDEK